MKQSVIMFCLLFLFAAPLFAAEDAGDRIMASATFDDDTSSGLAQALLANQYISLAKEAGPDGSDAILVAYVGYEQGSRRVGVFHPLNGEADQATLSFDVCFDKDFQWVMGGKLHGLGPLRFISGGQERLPAGWSARIMFNANGHCSTYLYDQDLTKHWGIGKRSSAPVFEAGRWHHVVLQVGLNTPGEADGFSRILIDGEEVVLSENVIFRKIGGSESRIQRFLFSTFHGGNNPQWTPVDDQGNPTTVHALFDNFLVTEGLRPR